MKADGTSAPTPIESKVEEGVAISRTRMRIAWSNSHQQYPDRFQPGESALYVADVVYDGGVPRLANTKEILRAHQPECTLDAQDFRFDDTQLIYTCYRGDKADVMGVDLAYRRRSRRTARLPTNTMKRRASRPTANGCSSNRVTIKATRSGRHSTTSTSGGCVLEPNGTNFVRMTRFGEYEGHKASNPVVSPDQRSFAFQAGRNATRRVWDTAFSSFGSSPNYRTEDCQGG